jgi:hypothetical protein
VRRAKSSKLKPPTRHQRALQVKITGAACKNFHGAEAMKACNVPLMAARGKPSQFSGFN